MTAPAPETEPTPPPGRRERKKQATREALLDAAFRLFSEKGYEATTVEEIADAVDVSARTFFRYFASKEDVALTSQEAQFHAMLDAFASRPPEESVLTALREAGALLIQAMDAADATDERLTRFDCLMRLTEESPALRAGSMELTRRKNDEMTRVIAARMGTDPETDLRPRMFAAMASTAFMVAADAYRTGLGGFTSFAEVVDAAFEVLEKGFKDY
ncbi:TetR family transcriptional regulator [Actinomadura logoneensis]|uniref:TetR family transcriptional regulator n=1 Tax=Actinomadura logoneensis TaxID=2293572 RepID=A0A372JAV7_9ACTN|nr:TetR family transcriptional regulator [Actinomadura logoneensis]RFU37127.1 TetR family transcriptional regulator [Actinomadura logoneensis]